jgi:hypothetical protein
MDKKTTVKIIIPVIIGLVIGLSMYYISKEKKVSTMLKNAAKELNEKAPYRTQNNIRLDSASTSGESVFIYHYSIVNADKSKIDLTSAKKVMKPRMIKTVKASSELKAFRDNNVTLDYRYYDKNGEFVTNIAITPELYNK